MKLPAGCPQSVAVPESSPRDGWRRHPEIPGFPFGGRLALMGADASLQIVLIMRSVVPESFLGGCSVGADTCPGGLSVSPA